MVLKVLEHIIIEKIFFVKGYSNPNTIETNDAGDTFYEAVLSKVLEFGFDKLDIKCLENTFKCAKAAISLITIKKGTLCFIPSRDEIKAEIKIIIFFLYIFLG